MKIKKIIFATHNPGKIKEMKNILTGLKLKILSASEIGLKDEVKEDQDTFIGNAIKKAVFVAEKSGEWAVADDSGICIKALGGAPGVKSARWAGKNATDNDLVNLTLKKLKNIPNKFRSAYFETSAVIVSPQGKVKSFTGRIYGKVADKPIGINRPRLPYDIIFIPKGHKKTFSEMIDREKNSLSHRGQAFKKLKEYIKKNNIK